MYGDSGVKFKEPSSFNLVSLTFLLVLLAVSYAAWKYLPVYWQKLKIEEMMQTVLIRAHRDSDETMRNTILLRVKEEFGYVDVLINDVKVSRKDGWVEATVIYPVTIEHLGARQHHFWLTAVADRKLLDI